MSQVVGLYVVVGCCLGLINAMSNTLITWVQAGRNVGPWVNLVNASFGLGASGAPLLFVAVEKRVGNGLAVFSAIAAIAAIPAVAASILPSPSAPPPKSAAAPEDESTKPLKGLGTGHGTSTLAGVDLGSRANYVRVTVVAPLMVTMTLVIGSEIAFAGWVYSYAMERVGMKSTEAAYLNSLFWTTPRSGASALSHSPPSSRRPPSSCPGWPSRSPPSSSSLLTPGPPRAVDRDGRRGHWRMPLLLECALDARVI